MKTYIKIYLTILVTGFFLAGFSIQTVAAESVEIYKTLAENKCENIQAKVDEFIAMKSRNNFDFARLSYEKEAYQVELDAYISLEKAVSCLSADVDCRSELLNQYTIKERASGCVVPEAYTQSDWVENQYASDLFEDSARLFEQAEMMYFGSRHLSLVGEKFDENGKRVGLDSIMTDNIITRAGGGFLYSTQESLRDVFRGNIVKQINRVLGSIAILYLFILGAKFIVARGDAERLSDLKGQFAWIALGLCIISVAEYIGYEIFDPSGNNDILEGNATRNFRTKIMDVVRFFQYMAAGLLLINAIISAYGLIISGEEEEAISKEKQFIKSFLLGTAFILLAEVIVRALSFQNNATIADTTETLIIEIAGIVNFSLSFMGIIAVAMTVMAGLYYVISFGDEDQMGRAKKMIINSLIGVIIAFSAYAIVSFLIV